MGLASRRIASAPLATAQPRMGTVFFAAKRPASRVPLAASATPLRMARPVLLLSASLKTSATRGGDPSTALSLSSRLPPSESSCQSARRSVRACVRGGGSPIDGDLDPALPSHRPGCPVGFPRRVRLMNRAQRCVSEEDERKGRKIRTNGDGRTHRPQTPSLLDERRRMRNRRWRRRHTSRLRLLDVDPLAKGVAIHLRPARRSGLTAFATRRSVVHAMLALSLSLGRHDPRAARRPRGGARGAPHG